MTDEHTRQESEENQDLDAGGDLREQRLRKLEDLQARGVEVFSDPPDKTFTSAQQAYESFTEAETGEETEEEDKPRFTLAGRLTAKRDMGKSVFADLRDQSGRIQLYAKKNILGEDAFEIFNLLDIGDIVAVEGPLFKTRKGEITVRLEWIRLLTKSLRTLPEKWHGLTDVEQRHRHRYLDLISNSSVREIFRKRTEVVREIRAFLDDKDFMEVETPMLQPLPGGAAAEPFETYYAALRSPMFLRIAPELYLKRLLTGGFERVYELNRNFRNEGLSRHHNPEFTMLEVYQAYGDCRSVMDLTEELITTVAQNVLGTLCISTEENTVDLSRPWERVRYHDLIRRHLGEDWFDLTDQQRRERAQTWEITTSPEMTEVEITQEVYEKTIEPNLINPVFITELPAPLVPLAKKCRNNPETVDVFELVFNGQEIAPGYSELNDPLEQRQRLLEQLGVETVEQAEEGQIDEDFLTALEYGMPPAGGMGIGVDRLVMTLLGVDSIREVILFPHLRQKSG